jgi:hypothetical protein
MSDPKYWFDRAEEVRTSANSMKSPANRARMLRVAEDFEILGRRAHQLPKNQKSVPKKKRLRTGRIAERAAAANAGRWRQPL